MSDLCNEQDAMLGVSWAFSVIWFVLLLVWSCMLIAGCMRKQLHCLQTIMLIVPFFHLGDAVWQLWTYTHCTCMQCTFQTIEEVYTWLGWQYTFSLGRLSALLLCLFLISTGAGTVRSCLLCRNWVQLIVGFVGFITASALGLPLSVAQLGVDSFAAFVWAFHG